MSKPPAFYSCKVAPLGHLKVTAWQQRRLHYKRGRSQGRGDTPLAIRKKDMKKKQKQKITTGKNSTSDFGHKYITKISFRPTYLPSGILIHRAIWQCNKCGPKIGGCAPLGRSTWVHV